MDEATRKRLDIKSIEECKAAARCAIDDIAFLRTHYGEVCLPVRLSPIGHGGVPVSLVKW